MLRQSAIIVWAILAAAGTAAPAGAADRPTDAVLEAVQFAPAGDHLRVLVTLSRQAPFQAVMAGTPTAAELSFEGVRVASSAVAGSGFGLVRTYRVIGADAGHVRMHFDLSGPAEVEFAGLAPSAPGRAVQIVLELAPADSAPGHAVRRAEASTSGAHPRQAASNARIPQPVRSEARLSDPPLRAGSPESGAHPGDSDPIARLMSGEPSEARPKVAEGRPLPLAGRRVIVIDPGHGGIDPGADSILGYHEKTVTLATARVLKKTLEDTGRYKVVLTRDRDTYLKLSERVRRARNAHGALFVSLHADSIGGGGGLEAVAYHSARGASVYTLSETASDAESERIAQRENKADTIGGINVRDQGADVANILVGLTMRQTINDGNRFANMIVDSFDQDGVDLLPRAPHRSAGFAVLKSPDIPSILIEMGYLSDPADASGLADAGHQRRIARAVAAAIDRYFAWVDRTRS